MVTARQATMKTLCALTAIVVLSLQVMAAQSGPAETALPPVGEKTQAPHFASAGDKHFLLPFLTVVAVIAASPFVRRAFRA